MDNVKIWISGSRGFIGRHVLDAVTEDPNYQLHCVTNNDTPDEGVTYIDFSDRKHIRDAIHLHGVPDVFLHLGWGAVYEPQSEVHLTDNVDEGKKLISELYEGGLKTFVFLGSASEYGDLEGSLSENMNGVGKLTNYVKGKNEVSEYGFEIAKQLNRVFLHVRLFYTFGAGQQHNSLINQLYKNAVDNVTMNLSPCEHYRDYIHVSDVVEGLKRICRVDESAIVNLGSGRVVQLRDFVEHFWMCLDGAPGALNFGAHKKPANEPGQPRSYANLENLKRLTDWMPSLSLDAGIEKTVRDLSNMHSV